MSDDFRHALHSGVIDHFGIGVGDYEMSKAFYTSALAPLGITLLMTVDAKDNRSGFAACGFGRDRPDFWIGGEGKTTPPAHFCFLGRARAEIDAFYAAALEAGGRDNGAPGLRPKYGMNYYAAFVLDLDGHNIEAVCRATV